MAEVKKAKRVEFATAALKAKMRQPVNIAKMLNLEKIKTGENQ